MARVPGDGRAPAPASGRGGDLLPVPVSAKGTFLVNPVQGRPLFPLAAPVTGTASANPVLHRACRRGLLQAPALAWGSGGG
ncbi:hypothetical protein GCM10010324_57210 [Streptomyces hiroshimensis]|uniref:Uncharacterized protein n=1 Tax=Streptomyces hiroshimensis TaxID=66424 RepID=A0ABQ2Z5Y8_9ACTN|nr:hypothetical protein GCM10010324_57210 [Streptomyces hiroshimensis]